MFQNVFIHLHGILYIQTSLPFELKQEFDVNITFHDYSDVDNNVISHEIFSLDKICENEPKKSENELIDTDEDTVIPSYVEAVRGFKIFSQYLEGQENVPDEIFRSFQKLDSFHVQTAAKKTKQKNYHRFQFKCERLCIPSVIS